MAPFASICLAFARAVSGLAFLAFLGLAGVAAVRLIAPGSAPDVGPWLFLIAALVALAIAAVAFAVDWALSRRQGRRRR